MKSWIPISWGLSLAGGASPAVQANVAPWPCIIRLVSLSGYIFISGGSTGAHVAWFAAVLSSDVGPGQQAFSNTAYQSQVLALATIAGFRNAATDPASATQVEKVVPMNIQVPARQPLGLHVQAGLYTTIGSVTFYLEPL